MRKLRRRDSGQATTEYILMLSIVVGIFIAVIKNWIGPAYSRLTATVTKNLEQQLMGADLHYFPMRR